MTASNNAPRELGPWTVGPIGFGCWRFVGSDVANAERLINTALDASMNLIDTADVYGLGWGGTHFGESEELLGLVLAASPGLRDRMVLATKGGIMPPVPYDSSREYLTLALEDSLRRLQTDRIDLYLVHRHDMYTHPRHLAETLQGFVDSGKVGSVGVSNYTPAQTEALVAHLDIPLIAIQPQFSALHLDPMRDGTLDQAMRLDIRPLAWSPLAGGRLATGEDVSEDLLTVLDELAIREGTDRAAVAVAFVLAHPSSPVALVGSQTVERLNGYSAALDVHLSRADCYRIVQASEGVPLP